MSVVEVVAAVLLVTGTVFFVGGAIGVLRFPDFYTRLHAAGKCDTVGQALVLIGLIVSAGLSLVSVKLAIIVFFVFLLNPTATHALARGAWVCGVRPLRDETVRPFVQREGQMTYEERAALVEPLSITEGERGSS